MSRPLYQIQTVREPDGTVVYHVKHRGGHIGIRTCIEVARQFVQEHFAARDQILDVENYDIIEGKFGAWK